MYEMLRNWSLVFVFPCAALVFFDIDLTYWFEHYPGRVPCLFCLFCIKNSDWKIILRGIHKHSSNQYSLLCQFLKFCLTMSSLGLVCSKPVEIILYLFIDILLCFCIGLMVKAWSGILCNDYCTDIVRVIVHSILLKDVGVQFCEEGVPLQIMQGCKSYPPAYMLACRKTIICEGLEGLLSCRHNIQNHSWRIQKPSVVFCSTIQLFYSSSCVQDPPTTLLAGLSFLF